MSTLQYFIDVFLHFDHYIYDFTLLYGNLIYTLLFIIIFCETGLIITPFLPGDSLLFAAGTLAAIGQINIHYLVLILTIAAVLGDIVNYSAGKYFGRRLFSKPNAKFFNLAHLKQTEAFFEKHGKKAIIIARFLPILRTFAPFTAGIAHMHYRIFIIYNVVGAIVWVSSFCYGAFLFGNLTFVKNHFSAIMMTIIVLSSIPAVVAFLRHRRLRN